MLLLGISLFCGTVFWFHPIPELTKSWTQFAHDTCLGLIAPDAPHFVHSAALVCGRSWSSSELHRTFVELGLIHLMVVSGSHLIFWRGIFAWLGGERHTLLKMAAFLFLTALCLITQWQPPIVRAALQIIAQIASVHWRLFWRTDQVAFIAGLLCLCLFPHWLSSLSLLLSWTACLTLTMPSPSRLRMAAQVHLFLLPMLLPLGAPSLVAILANWMFAPFLSLVLYPLTLASVVLPVLSPALNLLWKLIGTMSVHIGAFTPDGLPPFPIPIIVMWVYLLALHCWIHRNQVRSKQ